MMRMKTGMVAIMINKVHDGSGTAEEYSMKYYGDGDARGDGWGGGIGYGKGGDCDRWGVSDWVPAYEPTTMGLLGGKC